MKKSISTLIYVVLSAISLQSCFDLKEEIFNRVSSTTFYQDENSVKASVAAIYREACMSYVEYFMYLAEFSADQVAWRTWNGGSWGYDNAEKFVLSTHFWNSNSVIIRQSWNTAWTTIGQCNLVMSDLEKISPESIGMTSAQINSYMAEVRMMRAWAYYNVFEVWGGAIPIYTSSDVSELPASASAGGDFNSGCKKVFDFIIEELDGCLNDLPKNRVERMNQAMNRVLKARLLLNAEVYINENHFGECAALCESILGGAYGNYSIATDYRQIFSINNQNCPEVIFAYASAPSQLDPTNTRNMSFLPYNYGEFLTVSGANYSSRSGWNCTCLVPSYDNSGIVNEWGGTDQPVCFLDPPYNDKLGATWERMNNKDVRKQNYVYDPETSNYTGQFFIGPMINLGTGEPVKADADRNNEPLVYVDQVGTFKNRGRQLETVMSPRWGETNSGIRMAKYPMAPGYFEYRNIYEVEFRLSEVVYMLAECRMRAGNADEAKNLINSVRQRYFSVQDWETVKNVPGRAFTAFDNDWVLSEWGLEFLFEGRRRRTDLRRFDKFTQGQWWFFGRATEEGIPLAAKRDRMYEWFPLPETALSVNPNLEQNSNYK